jgi:sarcosine oxidase subunit beta
MPEVVVVGGGIIGAACAYELARRGVSVTLIERADLAAGASGRNQGLWVPPDDPVNHEMAVRSLDSYREFKAEASLSFVLDEEPVGLLLVAADDREVEEGRSQAEGMRARHIPVNDLEPKELAQLEPAMSSDLAAAWLVHDGYRLDPGALTVALALRAKEFGAKIKHHLFVRALVGDDERVLGVVTDDGVVEADDVIVATGAWTPPLLDRIGFRLPVTGARGWLVRMDSPPDLLRHLVESPDRSILTSQGGGTGPTANSIIEEGLPSSRVATILHPSHDGPLLVGSSRQFWLTPEPHEKEVVPAFLSGACRLVPRLADVPVASAWWGVRPMSPDDRPIVGRLTEGLIVATGHGSEGVILAGGTAQLVAAIVAADPPPLDPSPFHPNRFMG